MSVATATPFYSSADVANGGSSSSISNASTKRPSKNRVAKFCSQAKSILYSIIDIESPALSFNETSKDKLRKRASVLRLRRKSTKKADISAPTAINETPENTANDDDSSTLCGSDTSSRKSRKSRKIVSRTLSKLNSKRLSVSEDIKASEKDDCQFVHMSVQHPKLVKVEKAEPVRTSSSKKKSHTETVGRLLANNDPASIKTLLQLGHSMVPHPHRTWQQAITAPTPRLLIKAPLSNQQFDVTVLNKCVFNSFPPAGFKVTMEMVNRLISCYQSSTVNFGRFFINKVGAVPRRMIQPPRKMRHVRNRHIIGKRPPNIATKQAPTSTHTPPPASSSSHYINRHLFYCIPQTISLHSFLRSQMATSHRYPSIKRKNCANI